MQLSLMLCTHDLGAYTYRLVDVKAVGRCMRNFTPTVGVIAPITVSNNTTVVSERYPDDYAADRLRRTAEMDKQGI